MTSILKVDNIKDSSDNQAISISNGVVTFANDVIPTDNVSDLGTSSSRYKDLFLSGGAYLGGTGSANKLDDYEEGTWTPVYGGSTSAGTVSLGSTEGLYTKTGNFVTIWLRLSNITLSNATGIFKISGLPFTSSHGSNAYASTAIAMTHAINFDTARNQSLYLIGTDLYGLESINGAAWVDWGVTNGSGIYMNYTVTYRTA